MLKNIFGLVFFILVSLTSYNISAQSKTVKTDTITINGNCGQCKERIEEAAYLKGVKLATWDKKTKILTLVYNPKKTTITKVAEAIAQAGHDSQQQTASDAAYKKLPSCCAYRTSECHHD